MDSPPKIPQKWRLFNFKASWTQGLLDSEGSFLQLIFTLIRFVSTDHPQRERLATHAHE